LEKPLFDPVAGLTGKPDYLVKKGRAVVPVEVKSGRTPEAPYDAHIYQLAAYCLLVEREYGVRPPYGIIHYPTHTFAVDYTAGLESALLDVLGEIRVLERREDIERSHDENARCKGCGYQSECNQRL
jgi:CRISPR-associated exonuclease Cas4